MSSKGLHRVVGTVAIGAATLVMLADLIELTSGGFSALQLYMAYVAFAAIPFVMVVLRGLSESTRGSVGPGSECQRQRIILEEAL
jgi:hypothetical protein